MCTSTSVQDRIQTFCLDFPASFCAIRLINDTSYTEKEVGPPKAEEKAANYELYWENSIEIRDTFKRQNMRDFRRYTLLEVGALRKIPTRAELFVNYGKGYSYFH